MTTTGIVLIAVLVMTPVVIGLVVGLALRGRVQRGLYAGTGLAEWTEQAKRLPWSDRLHLARANNRGRAAKPELAATGAHRGRVMIAAVDRYSTWPAVRWILRLGLVLSVVQIAFNVWLLTGDDPSWIHWANLVLWPFLFMLWVLQPWLQRRQRARLERSVELNEALAAQQPGQQPRPSVPAPGPTSGDHEGQV